MGRSSSRGSLAVSIKRRSGMDDALLVVVKVSALVFVLSSMLAM
jgi:hypothetical protein